MIYPIFNSVTNQIERNLNERNLNINSFKTWNEDRINATGLEIEIDLQGQSDFLKALSINFDWDRFRETALAQQLEGMQEHPFLQEENMVKTSITPDIDIEINWLFNEKAPHPALAASNGNHQLEAASQWMEEISEKVNDLLSDDDIITRWHVEVEGTKRSRYLAAVNLLSYFQYTLGNMHSLNEVHNFVLTRLQELLIKSNRILHITNQTLQMEAA